MAARRRRGQSAYAMGQRATNHSLIVNNETYYLRKQKNTWPRFLINSIAIEILERITSVRMIMWRPSRMLFLFIKYIFKNLLLKTIILCDQREENKINTKDENLKY